jgi:hypothetical protein
VPDAGARRPGADRRRQPQRLHAGRRVGAREGAGCRRRRRHRDALGDGGAAAAGGPGRGRQAAALRARRSARRVRLRHLLSGAPPRPSSTARRHASAPRSRASTTRRRRDGPRLTPVADGPGSATRRTPIPRCRRTRSGRSRSGRGFLPRTSGWRR